MDFDNIAYNVIANYIDRSAGKDSGKCRICNVVYWICRISIFKFLYIQSYLQDVYVTDNHWGCCQGTP